MIAFCQSAPPLDETLIGCRMQTLLACYGTLPNGVDWYQSGAGGVLCRFGGTLLIDGDADFNELLAFADMLGTARIEWVTGSAGAPFLPSGWTSQSYPVLCSIGAALAQPPIFETNVALRRCFELLCQSDAQFSREAQYLPWLSDMTRRRNAGRTMVFTLSDAAVACITARGRHSAYLSSVAVLPGRQGEGLGLALVRSVTAHPALRGVAIYTAAQTVALGAFYKKAGFAVLPQYLTIAEKRILA